MDEKTIVKELRICNSNFSTVGKNVSHILAELKKNSRKIRGLKVGVILLSVSSLILASELAERKRCENYLKGEIDELKMRVDDLTGVGKEDNGGAADA